MRSSVDLPPSVTRNVGSRTTNNNSNNNNNNNNSDSGNSGSQYALCALGVGVVALGIIMIVWSVADVAEGPGSEGGKPGGGSPINRNKTSYVAFVLVGSGVVMLLLSMCLGMRNKQREQEWLQRQGRPGVAAEEQEEVETPEERAQRYAVPSYEEAVGSAQYPVRQSNPHNSVQLPSYDDLVKVDGVQYETEGPEGQAPTGSQPVPASAGPGTSASNHSRSAKASRKLLPLKIRRIKSEKMHVKNEDNSQPISVISIEPLTPPPQYEDKVVPL